MKPVDKVLERLDGVRQEGDGWKALCPIHDDHDPSLSINEGDDERVLLKCFAGCETERVVSALGIEMRDLFLQAEGGDSASSHQTSQTAKLSLTLAEYAEAKCLTIEFLAELGLEDFNYRGSPAVRIPYLEPDGTIRSVRFRRALEKSKDIDDRFAWRKDDKTCFYGLQRLEKARKEGYIVVVEGESDAQTLWHNGIPAIGVPGATTFRLEWAADLEGIERVYVVVEPDQGGKSLWERLVASPLRERLWRVDLEDAEDVSALHLADPNTFKQRFKKALDRAVAWLDLAETEEQERTREAWEVCEELATSPDILAVLAADLQACGVAGDPKAAKLLYLAINSRHLDSKMLVNVAVKGLSGAGKSYLTEKVLSFFPEEAYYFLTSMSERALAYGTEPLAHRFLVLAEAAGMNGEFQTYLIRSLLSEGKLRYETVEKTGEGLKPRLIEREGPTGLIVTTTRLHLHPENETRMLGVSVDDGPEQTQAILETIADEDRGDPDMTRWHALQTWIASRKVNVTVPYAKTVARLVPNTLGVRLRRDFGSILNLIRSHALLHQATRDRDEKGRIVANLNDYAAVRELVSNIVAHTLEAAVPPKVREAVEAVSGIYAETGKAVTIKQVGDRLGLSKEPAHSRVREAINRGFLKNLEDHKGRPAMLICAEPLPEDVEVLPTPEKLIEKGFGGLAGLARGDAPSPHESRKEQR